MLRAFLCFYLAVFKLRREAEGCFVFEGISSIEGKTPPEAKVVCFCMDGVFLIYFLRFGCNNFNVFFPLLINAGCAPSRS